MKIYIIFFILIDTFIFSQIKGKVVDDKNQPVSFVNIQIQNENIGTTTEIDGSFLLNESDIGKNLVFTAIGFEKMIVKCVNNILVVLQTAENQLDEVVIVKHYNTKEVEIGKTNNTIASVLDNGPKIDAKFFEYLPRYAKTKFIKQVSVQTDSKIDNASFKLHLYSVDKNGYPGQELLKKNLILTVNNGVKKTFFNIQDYNLAMPKNGIFVAYEKLIVDKNKLIKTIINKNNLAQKTQTIFYPWILCNYIERDFQFTCSGGKWIKKEKSDNQKLMVYEPAINLVLTN